MTTTIMYKKICALITLLMTISSISMSVTAQNILLHNFEISFISRGDNFPDFSLRNDSAKFLLVYLHEKLPVTAFQHDANLDDETVNETISLLKEKNWLHETDGKLYPTVFIATEKDGEELYTFAEPISAQISAAIEKRLPIIKAEFIKTEMSKNQSFNHWSFLILSNVLLDNWNIFPMERAFLKTEDRPLRHGKNYYAAIKENNGTREAFGIYGNQYADNFAIYGNNRLNISDKKKISENIISSSDNGIFEKMAADFLPELLKILENNKPYFEEIYHKTGYSEEITFNEFFIWWYHFIYTQTTNELASKGLLTIPENGNFVYLINNSRSNFGLIKIIVLCVFVIAIVFVTFLNAPKIGSKTAKFVNK